MVDGPLLAPVHSIQTTVLFYFWRFSWVVYEDGQKPELFLNSLPANVRWTVLFKIVGQKIDVLLDDRHNSHGFVIITFLGTLLAQCLLMANPFKSSAQ